MAIYNPKRARELEAAARLAESQRQREMAKGQREQRTTEQILGLVEGLIGAAPQAAQAFEQSQAERVLAGERPLEMEAAKDPFTGLGRLLFEPGIKAKAQKMAQERAPAEVAKLRPTVKTVAEGVPEANKFLMPQDQLTKEGAVRKELERSPVLQILPEREREALAFGEVQTAEAEQAAAERQRKFDEAELAKLDAQKQAALAKKGQKLDIGVVSGALETDVSDLAVELRERLNSTDEDVASEARQQINQRAEDIAVQLGYDPNDARVRAGISKAIGQAYKAVDMKPLSEKSIKQYAADADAINSLVRLDALRKKSGWSPDKEEVLKQYVVDTLDLPFNLENVLEIGRNGFIRAGLTAEDYNYMAEAQIVRQKMALAVFKGTGAVSENERSSVEPFVLTPWSTGEEWDLRFRTTVQTLASPFVSEVLAQKEVSKVPSELIRKAERFGLYADPNEYDAAIEGILQEAAAPEFGKDRPGRLQQADQVKMLGSALADSPQILAKSLPEFTKTMITTAKDIGVDLAEEQLEDLAPLVFGMLSSLSGGTSGTQQAQKPGLVKVQIKFKNGTSKTGFVSPDELSKPLPSEVESMQEVPQ